TLPAPIAPASVLAYGHQCSGTVVAHWVLKQWPQLALDAISQITFQMDNKHSSYPVCIGIVKPDVDHLHQG
ncbi:hypothetical protein BBC54_21470, partial [Salmonella enterica subsp. enterica serovar Thompson]|uniref:hypothetical protein n=3 Tax=Enterobacterales TaxID=91347 RepID=UPI000812E64E